MVLASASREAKPPGFRLKSNGEPVVRSGDAAGVFGTCRQVYMGALDTLDSFGFRSPTTL